MGATWQIFSPPFHPYTEALLSAIPIADPRVKKRRVVLEGDLPTAPRRQRAVPSPRAAAIRAPSPETCASGKTPPIRSVADGHTIKCHLPTKALERMEPVFSVDGCALPYAHRTRSRPRSLSGGPATPGRNEPR